MRERKEGLTCHLVSIWVVCVCISYQVCQLYDQTKSNRAAFVHNTVGGCGWVGRSRVFRPMSQGAGRP